MGGRRVDEISSSHIDSGVKDNRQAFEKYQVARLQFIAHHGNPFAVYRPGVTGKLDVGRLGKNRLDESGTVHAGARGSPIAIGHTEIGIGGFFQLGYTGRKSCRVEFELVDRRNAARWNVVWPRGGIRIGADGTFEIRSIPGSGAGRQKQANQRKERPVMRGFFRQPRQLGKALVLRKPCP